MLNLNTPALVTPSGGGGFYSVLKLFTGLAVAALMV